MAEELDRLADAIDRLRQLNADLRLALDEGERRIFSERQARTRKEVIAALGAVRAAAKAGDEDAKELLTALEIATPG